MKQHHRIPVLRWALIGSLLLCLYGASHGALLLYFMSGAGGLSSYQPPSAETVSRAARSFQLNTPETNGMFKIIQEQHSRLGMTFERLEIAEELNWSLAWSATVAFSVLSAVLGLCLALMPKSPTLPDTEKQGL